MLNLRDALKLAELLDPYVPERPELDTPILEFVGKILTNVVDAGKHADYLAAAEIATQIPADELLMMDVNMVTQLFITALIENKFLVLLEFYRGARMKLWQTKKS